MATADSVKAKLQGLIDKSNATTGNTDADLTTAVDALVAGYGQGGGGSGIIDVTELPSAGSIYVVADEDNDGTIDTVVTVEEFFKIQMGVQVTINMKVVETLPDELDAPDLTAYIFPIYVVESTGIAYLNMDFTVTAGQMVFEAEGLDNGWSTDPSAETEAGIYCVRGEAIDETAVYRVTEEGSAEVYVVGEGGVSTVADAFDVVTEVYVVETLPETLTPCASGLFYFYVVESTGFAYLDIGSGTMSFGAVLNSLDRNSTDRGWTDDVTSETKYGSYCVRTAPTCTLYTYAEGEWTEYVDRSMADEECANAVEDATAPFVDYFATAFSVTVLEIPEGVGEIAHAIIDGTEWGNLKTIKFPASLTALNGNIVKNCENLAKVIFKGTPNRFIGSAAFVNCPKITDIYVPWASGAVGGAPWGAPDTATIHYNSDTANM